MTWRKLLNPDIQDFIRDHAGDDVSKLALKKPPSMDWPYRDVLEQIKARQKAAVKFPEWVSSEGILFPSSDLVEQASSSACSLYKSTLMQGERFCDLSAGLGVDAFSFARHFRDCVLVDADQRHADILAHNATVLGVGAEVEVVHARAEDYVAEMGEFDCLYIDPQRREGGKSGRFSFDSCMPNVLELLPVLRSKAKQVLLKTSPVLDISRAVSELGDVSQVHVVQWAGDVKEVLYLLDFEKPVDEPEIRAVLIGDDGGVQQSFSFCSSGEKNCAPEYGDPLTYIYEPAPACMKAGGFSLMAARFGLKKLHPQTHVYTADHLCFEFPGKTYVLDDVRTVKQGVADLGGAELVVRNFPLQAEKLRKKLGLSQGKDLRVFACTLPDGDHRLLVCRKTSQN